MVYGDLNKLFYITHIDNVKSILERGIYSHKKIEDENLQFTPVYDKDIVSNRKNIFLGNGKSLWDYANLYFQPRNPMLYRVVSEKNVEKIAVISISSSILSRNDIYISNGNAASKRTVIESSGDGRKSINKLKNVLNKEYWSEIDDSKRQIMSECLVPDFISPQYISSIYVAEIEVKKRLQSIIEIEDFPIIPEPYMFFRPVYYNRLTEKLFIVKGDMFFSPRQTLTISVNCVGVMGKGLASRAKYQFPEVYVYYQDMCRSQILKMGNPVLYKRDVSYESILIDDTVTMKNGNGEKWFLLFPTKKHWREKSDFNGIEQGLDWLSNNYMTEGIKSIALPALGCGLGQLEWKDIGPLMCRYLSKLDIPVRIYLPAEKQLPSEELTKEFLLS